MSSKPKTGRAVITIIIIAVIVGLLIFLKPSAKVDTPSASTSKAPTSLAVDMLIIKPVELNNSFYTSGNILANESVDLKSEANARVVKILFTEGAQVKQGQLLVKLNDDDLQAQLKKLQSSEVTAQMEQKRQKELLQVNGISQSDYDNIVNTLNGVKADIENMQAQIEKTEIRAPFDGVVGLRNISVGSYLSAGTMITTIQQLNPIKIDFSVPEKYHEALMKNAKITFTVDGVKDTFTAKVYADEPVVNANTGTIELRAQCANPDEKLVPGAFAHIVIDLNTINNALMVPSQSLVPKQNQESVFLVKNGKALSKSVTIGLRTDSTVQIITGISPGDTVITSSLLAVRNGMKVINSAGKNGL